MPEECGCNNLSGNFLSVTSFLNGPGVFTSPSVLNNPMVVYSSFGCTKKPDCCGVNSTRTNLALIAQADAVTSPM